ncbi:transglutaminase domain-containing protein [Nannocystis pusilla]|uniref:Transglutaminase-like domain-containing protein n=1 Tax=Nannocystis pusilla TaxID=889268 RepID=A0ABS7U696_9BACT|nr:transglutaminase domain-containing protein [Nannocystis pusilla]MBZ5715916.1 hypothetical protein [Nannocystis pusilla]
MTRARLSWLGTLLFWLFRASWAALVVVAPALGVWVASSLAAYRNGPVWLVCVAGLLLFPIVPVAWDMLSELLRRRRSAAKRDRRVLTTWDRIVLRTLTVNLAFLAALLWSRPEAAFTAISTRGDWFLEGVTSPAADRARGALLQAADGLQWLYEAAHDNQYAELIESKPAEAPAPQPAPVDDAWSDPWERPPQREPEPTAEPTPAPEVPEPAIEPPTPALAGPTWPSPAVVHPAVLAMPEDARASIDAVGRHLAASEPDPARRIKAIHDFVATHLAYDAASYLNRDVYPDQRAEAVFASRLAVCAGYANLMKAIAAVTGDEVVVVVGDARGLSREVEGESHAWNAARVDGRWYLIDATWDSGHLKDGAFVREYRSDYLFVPPALIGVTHFPEEPAWQLREQPLTRGEFARQPMMRPKFFADGLQLLEPRRSQVTVQREFAMSLDNPRARNLIVKAVPEDSSQAIECALTGTRKVDVACGPLPAGTYAVRIYTSPTLYGTYQGVGELQVHAAG